MRTCSSSRPHSTSHLPLSPLSALCLRAQTYGNQFVYPAGAPAVILAEEMVEQWGKDQDATAVRGGDDAKAQSSGDEPSAAASSAAGAPSAALLKIAAHLTGMGGRNPIEHASRIAYAALHYSANAARISREKESTTRGTKRSRAARAVVVEPPTSATQLLSVLTEEPVSKQWLSAVGGSTGTTRPFLRRNKQPAQKRCVCAGVCVCPAHCRCLRAATTFNSPVLVAISPPSFSLSLCCLSLSRSLLQRRPLSTQRPRGNH